MFGDRIQFCLLMTSIFLILLEHFLKFNMKNVGHVLNDDFVLPDSQ